MAAYTGEQIRNVGIVGHGDTGKTQLVSSLLFTAGVGNRLTRTIDGNTVTDWDDEEIARKITIKTGLAHAEWTPPSGKPHKINLLDTPGYSTFINETKASLIAADCALILVDAVAGVQVVTEKVWDYCTEYDIPRAFVINWMDRELASFERALESVKEVFGRAVVPVQLPIGAEKTFRGAIDLISMKAHIYQPDGNGKAKVEEIPADMAEAAKAAHEALVEMVAEGDDKLMEEFFEQGTLPVEDLVEGLRSAVAEKRIVPLLVASGLHNIGSEAILNFICELFPSPLERKTVSGTKEPAGKGDRIERKITDKEPVSLFVWKTMADPFSGRVSYFKVMSGVLKNDASLANYTRTSQERLQHIHVQQGKTATEVAELHAGDIGTVNKLKDTL
ncbi:MAG: GTP-binding protein, partial [Candidatus Acidiferrales bacterium]